MNFRFNRISFERYALAVLAAAIAGVLTTAIQPLFNGKAPLFFFIVAVILSALRGGVGPGLAATATSVAIVFSFFQAQVLVLAAAYSGLMLFAILGAGISLAMGHLHGKNTMIALAKRQLEASNGKLSEQTEALARANEELQRFAHDLTTPMRSISLLAELLVQRNAGKLDEGSKECADMILKKAQRTQAMIKGLLDYAAAVEKPEERAMVDCSAVLERALEDLDGAINECAARIITTPLPHVPASEPHLVQVFSNLISNAIKYRPAHRQPVVQVSCSDTGDEWCFCVRDNGIGLNMKDAIHIFGMFRRADESRQFEGTGIGLALCKMIIERHGGRIWVESELGRGSQFYFALPKGDRNRAQKTRSEPLSASSQRQSGTIS